MKAGPGSGTAVRTGVVLDMGKQRSLVFSILTLPLFMLITILLSTSEVNNAYAISSCLFQRLYPLISVLEFKITYTAFSVLHSRSLAAIWFFVYLIFFSLKVSAIERPANGGWHKSSSPVLSLFNLREKNKFWSEKVMQAGKETEMWLMNQWSSFAGSPQCVEEINHLFYCMFLTQVFSLE